MHKNVKECFAIGINQVIQSLQKSSSNILVLSDEISPKFLGYHLIALGLTNNPELAIIIVPRLKSYTKTHFGISSIIFSTFKETVSKTDPLAEFCFKNCDQETFTKEYNINISKSKSLPIKRTKVVPILPNINLEDIYLKVNDKGKAAFSPETNSMELEEEKQEFGSDFISLDSHKHKKQKGKSCEYKTFVMRKIKGKPK